MGAHALKAKKLTLILIVLVVVSVGLFAFKGTPARPCPLAIQFVGFTNDAIQTYGDFVVTNRSDSPLRFLALTELKVNGSWPTYPPSTVLPHGGPYDIGAKELHQLRASLPADGTLVRMSIVCAEPWTRLDRGRWRTSIWFHDQNLPAFGRFISEGKPSHVILSAEIHK
jgi:hypothetical protein